MNNSRPDINHQQKMADTEHFLWCALIALHLSRIDGKTPSPLMEHIFLQNWLVTAKKQRRFPLTVAKDIDYLIQLSRDLGPSAKLGQRLDTLWKTSIIRPQEDSPLSRLTRVIRILKFQGWSDITLKQRSWTAVKHVDINTEAPAIFILGIDLVECFSDAGDLTKSMDILSTGDADILFNAFKTEGLTIKMHSKKQSYYTIEN